MEDGLVALHSPKNSLRLEQIAALRSRGVGNHIDLPQLVVSGDQSAGKSSVLEGLTGLPFPRQDGVCTRFGTEILLRHSENNKLEISATIIPCKARDETSSGTLKGYLRHLESFTELPDVIKSVGALLGIRGFGSNIDGPSFAKDLLRVEVSGPVGLHLSVVDLPGIILVPNEEQTESDVEIVHSLVNDYIANPRTIILAVIQAGNDIANQSIVMKTRTFDPKGERTVGIITKPDLINEGSEKRISLLARNQDTTKLKLGYFLLKNPTPKELESGLDLKERHTKELAFFNASPWKEQDLNMDRVGIRSLQLFLQKLLDRHIEHELPKVRHEIRQLMVDTENKLDAMGEERPDLARMRLFLSRLSMSFHSLTVAALSGVYHETDSNFFPPLMGSGEQVNTRLRAVIHESNVEFASYMRTNGRKRTIVSTPHSPGPVSPESSLSGTEDEDQGQIVVTRKEMMDWVKETYTRNRGKELPGNTNHVLISELFHVQSGRWLDIAQGHVHSINLKISNFMRSALNHVVKEESVRSELSEMIFASLEKNTQAAQQELARLGKDEEQQPITYNHYYTDNIQRFRQDSLKNAIEKAMKETTDVEWNGRLHISNNTVDGQKLLASLQRRINVDMDIQACEEALAGLEAYYKVALKTFVDNVCRQVIERHLVRVLPLVFGPENVVLLSEVDLMRVAAEQPGNAERRNELRGLLDSLGQGLEDLRR